MAKFEWEVGPEDIVSLKLRWNGRRQVSLNGEPVQEFSGKTGPKFSLSDGRMAEAFVTWGLTQQTVELRVNGEMARLAAVGTKIRCEKCSAEMKAYDKFCESCGTPAQPPEVQQLDLSIKGANGVIGALSILFLLAGLLLGGIQYSRAQDALEKLAQYDAAAQWSEPVNGNIVTVGELREMVEWEPIGVLLVNILLAVVMAGLYFWGRRSPLPAVLVAAGTYLAVQVISAIVDPATIGQGIVLKIIIVAMLYRGIKAGFQQRSLQT